MSDALVIRLSTTDHAQWLLIDAVGGRLGVVLDGPLVDAAPLASGRKVIVLVPGTSVYLAEPTLPIKRGAQLEQVMRYALEEQLGSDIDDLHFAMGKRRTSGVTPVAVVAQNQMQSWLDALNAAGIAPDALFSEADVLPAAVTGPGSTCIVIDGPLLYLKRGNATGTTLDVQPLSDALSIALGAHTEAQPGASAESSGGALTESPADVLIYLHQNEYELHTTLLTTLRERLPLLQTKLLPEGPLPLFAPQAAQASAVNLLAGNYARKKTWNKSLAPWRIAAMLTGAVVLLHLGASGVRFWQLTRAEKQVDQQIRDVVTQTLPGVQVSDTRKARQQFEAQLSALRAGASSSGLLPGLNALAATLEQIPDTRLEALAYRAKIIDLRVTAPNVDTLARMQQVVGEQGLHADIQSATPRDNKTEGRLQLKLPGA